MTTTLLLGGFGLLTAAACALELRARSATSRLPTLGDLAGAVTRRRGTRMAVLVVWLWLGWHLFAR